MNMSTSAKSWDEESFSDGTEEFTGNPSNSYDDRASIQSFGSSSRGMLSISSQQSKFISYSRALMTFILVFATAVFATAIYVYSKHQENKEFETRVS